MNKNLLIIFLMFSLILSGCESQQIKGEETPKLYWFIPDGMRADPDIFNIFQWAEEGKLPNIKKMMDNGAYGYSIPTFPSHTPTNFATLFTGTYPKIHGVADGPMHVEGRPLSEVSISGFNSAAKKIDPIWVTLEKSNKKVALLSIPGSTPPELEKGITIRGRWGGWGADFHAINFEEFNEMQVKQGRGKKLFFFGPRLTEYPTMETAKEWGSKLLSYSDAKEITLNKYGAKIYAYIYDSTDDDQVTYDKIAFSFDKKEIIANLKKGEWSGWIPITLNWKVGDEMVPIETHFKIKVIKLGADGFYRIRLFYNNLNKFITKPSEVAENLIENVGPMVDFVDNFPPQLIYYEEDKDTFLEEADMSLNWHEKAASFIIENYNPDIFINDIYTPNQMLTSRWWMGYIDPQSQRYNEVSNDEREQLWLEVKSMYKKLDDLVGELLEKADENTYVILSSDHGAVPLDKWVRLNNLFAKKGWLKFKIDRDTGEPLIDWGNSTVIYLKMAHVYINPKGLGGNWTRASGEGYETLRNDVRKALLELKDNETGIKPVIAAYNWEDAPEYLDLPIDRVGDLVIVNEGGYGWNEEVTRNGKIFDTPLKTGYKQAIIAEKEKGMWTPFIIMGPGIKKSYQIEKPIKHVDQYPTIMTLLGENISENVQGRILNEILE